MTARISAAALQRMWQSGVPTADIAAHFGCHVDTVRRCAARLGLERRRHGGSKPRNQRALPCADGGYGAEIKRAEAALPTPSSTLRQATPEQEVPIMSPAGQYTNTTDSGKPEQTWQSIGNLARRLAEQATK